MAALEVEALLVGEVVAVQAAVGVPVGRDGVLDEVRRQRGGAAEDRDVLGTAPAVADEVADAAQIGDHPAAGEGRALVDEALAVEDDRGLVAGARGGIEDGGKPAANGGGGPWAACCSQPRH